MEQEYMDLTNNESKEVIEDGFSMEILAIEMPDLDFGVMEFESPIECSI